MRMSLTSCTCRCKPPEKELFDVPKCPCLLAQIKHRYCNRRLHSSQRAARIPQCSDKAFVTDRQTDGVRLAWDLRLLCANLYFGSI